MATTTSRASAAAFFSIAAAIACLGWAHGEPARAEETTQRTPQPEAPKPTAPQSSELQSNSSAQPAPNAGAGTSAQPPAAAPKAQTPTDAASKPEPADTSKSRSQPQNGNATTMGTGTGEGEAGRSGASRTAIQARLDNAGLCEPLQLDLRDVTGLIGIPIPSFLPIDTELRWGHGRHVVRKYEVTPSHVELDFTFACQPTSNGAVLSTLGLTPERLRLSAEAMCSGDRDETGELTDFDCQTSGRIGTFLTRHIADLPDRARAALPEPLAGAATPSP